MSWIEEANFPSGNFGDVISIVMGGRISISTDSCLMIIDCKQPEDSSAECQEECGVFLCDAFGKS